MMKFYYEPGLVIVALWLAFALSWIAAMLWRDRIAQSLGFVRELPYRIVLIVGGALLAIPAHGDNGPMRLWHVGLRGAWICIALMIVGFLFAWWARVHLGSLWSGNITA